VSFISFNCDKAPFTNADVRRAFSLAIDRQAVANLVAEGTPTLASDILPPCIAGYQAGSWVYSHHDQTAAAARLASAGYPGAAGLPTITYSFPSGDAVGLAIANQVKADLEAIGASVTLEPLDCGSLYTKLSGGTFMIAPSGWMADYPSADNFLYPLFQSGQNGAFTSYSNATVDADLLVARGATDAGARLADYKPRPTRRSARTPRSCPCTPTRISVSAEPGCATASCSPVTDSLLSARGCRTATSRWPQSRR
jgi:ABC-type transport system substrate-binding protein